MHRGVVGSMEIADPALQPSAPAMTDMKHSAGSALKNLWRLRVAIVELTERVSQRGVRVSLPQGDGNRLGEPLQSAVGV